MDRERSHATAASEMQDEILPFGPSIDNRVPGELVVKLSQEGELSITESIPAGPIRRIAVPLPTRFGVDALDQALSDLGVQSISKVHTPISNLTMAESGEGALAEAADTVHPPGVVPRDLTGLRLGAVAEDMSATYRLRLDPGSDLQQAAERLAGVEAVAEVSPNYFRFAQATPSDPMYGTQWGLTKINCPAAWDRTTGSASVIVAVVDSGVDLNHPDLQANLLPGYDAVDLVGVAPRPGWHFDGDFLTRDNDPQDEVGHGTHVAGTIAAVSNNGVGVAGVTWSCKILSVKVLARMVNNTDGRVTGTGTAVDIAAGIRWAVDHGAHIINMSLGGYNDTFFERDAVTYAVAKGCVVVAAMGNDDVNTPSFPAAYPNVVAVGAINSSDQRVSIANTGGVWGSNTGPHIDVVAPGVSIRSTDWDDTYSNKQGTSMATPHVAGVAALVKSCAPGQTAVQIAQILRETARNLRDAPSDPVPNDRYGFGLVDAQAAVQRACPVIKFKALDDQKFKFRDDIGTLKSLDDQKFKFRDDIGTLKFQDDQKLPNLDVGPTPSPGMPAPFMLATPHHSMAWARSSPEASQTTVAAYEARLAQYEAVLTEMEQARQQGRLTVDESQQLEAMRVF